MSVTAFLQWARSAGAMRTGCDFEWFRRVIRAADSRLREPGSTWRHEGTTFRDRCLKVTMSLARKEHDQVGLSDRQSNG
jgi:hypothetical protein